MKKITLYQSVLRLFVLTLLLSSMAILQSCKDATLEPEKVEVKTLENSVVLKDGRLIFKTGALVDKYIADLQKNKNSRKSYDVNIEGFKSMQEKYDELIKYDIGKAITDGTIENYKDVLDISIDDKGRKDYEIAVKNHLLASVLNENGLVQVGDKVIKMDGKTSKRVQEQNISDLFLPSAPNMEVIPSGNKINSDKFKNAKVAGQVDTERIETYYNYPGGECKRFRTYIGIYETFWSSNIYLEFYVTHKRDVWWGWDYDKTSGWKFWASGMAFYTYQLGPNSGEAWGVEYQGTSGSGSTDAVWWSRQISSNGGTIAQHYGEIYGKWEANGHDGIVHRYDMANDPDFPFGLAKASW